MTHSTSSQLRSKNIEFIQRINPGFIDSLPSFEDNTWEEVFSQVNDESILVNLKSKSDGSFLYPEPIGGQQYSVQTFHAWASQPTRLVVNDYSYMLDKKYQLNSFKKVTGVESLQDLDLASVHDMNQDLEPLWVSEQIAKFIRKESIEISHSSVTSEGCALVICGLGLGFQIAPLVEYLKPSALFIVEPDLSLLSHSLSTVDYSELIPKFTGDDRALDFIVSSSPEAAVAQIRSLLTVRNLFLMDGLFSFITFENSFYQLTRQLLHSYETLKSVNYLGYFLDEIHMTMNATLNYFHVSPKVYNSSKVFSHDKHAVVVASGPSLANDLEILKRYRDRFTIFCCYSTIGRLVEYGIIPDYHCDLERHNDHIPLIERGLQDILKDVSLCCSSTCDPRLLRMYKEVYSINRGALTPSVIFTQGNDIIPNEGPDVATFAILSAIFFGFRSIHLFGVDLGTADRSLCRLSGALDIDRRTYDVPVRGNHGSTVFSSQPLLDNKLAIESNIIYYGQAFPGLVLYNYSNGVYIEDTVSSVSDEFASRLPDNKERPPVPQFEPYSEDHVKTAWALADMRVRCFTFLNSIRSYAENPFDIATLYKVSDLCNALGKKYQDQIPIRFYRGSLFRSWLTLLAIYQRSLHLSEDKRLKLFDECKQTLLQVIDSFENLTFKMIDYVEEIKSIDDFHLASHLDRSLNSVAD